MLAESLNSPVSRLVRRRLASDLDPLSAYAALAGAAPDTALFQTPAGLALLMQRAAVRVECRGETVSLQALTGNGESLLATLASRLGESTSSDGLRLSLHLPPSRSLDLDERLHAPSSFDALRALLAAAAEASGEPFAAAAIGVVAFDHSALGEDLPDNAEDPLDFPDYLFWIPDALIVFEPGLSPRLLCTGFADPDPRRSEHNYNDAVSHLERLTQVCRDVPPLAMSVLESAAAPNLATADLDDESFADLVRALKREIVAGEVYQIVPSRTFQAPCRDPFGAFVALAALEPRSYRFFVQSADFSLFGASPETSVRVSRESGGKTVEVRPIAGTRPRGRTADEDDRLEVELRLDPKEVAEHMMLVDLARNDVARISVPGSRRVSALMKVERHARVMHLVSSVTGRLAGGFDALHALSACLNVGTLSGAPKIRATELLRQVERTRRGPYGGAVGYLNGAGLMDTAVVIRSALVKHGTAFVRAGAGVVHESVPEAEAAETRHKAAAILAVLAATEAGAGG